MKDIIADEPKNEQAASSAVETIVIREAFEKMLKNEPIKLSKVGINELNDSWQGEGNSDWYIKSVDWNNEIEIISENHAIFSNVPHNWIIWDSV